MLVLERFDVAGIAAAGQTHRSFVERPLFTATLFFGSSSSSASDSRPNFSCVDANSEDISRGIVGCGFGARFGDAGLADFRRRTGLTTEAVSGALADFKTYRLKGGLL